MTKQNTKVTEKKRKLRKLGMKTKTSKQKKSEALRIATCQSRPVMAIGKCAGVVAIFEGVFKNLA